MYIPYISRFKTNTLLLHLKQYTKVLVFYYEVVNKDFKLNLNL